MQAALWRLVQSFVLRTVVYTPKCYKFMFGPRRSYLELHLSAWFYITQILYVGHTSRRTMPHRRATVYFVRQQWPCVSKSIKPIGQHSLLLWKLCFEGAVVSKDRLCQNFTEKKNVSKFNFHTKTHDTELHYTLIFLCLLTWCTTLSTFTL